MAVFVLRPICESNGMSTEDKTNLTLKLRQRSLYAPGQLDNREDKNKIAATVIAVSNTTDHIQLIQTDLYGS